MKTEPGGPAPDSHSVDGLCIIEQMSRTFLYGEWAKGEGPDFYYRGRNRRISEEARLAWRNKLQAKTAAKLKAESTAKTEAAATALQADAAA
jgi:hypothetical protein